ncbi:hypothetical protein JCM17846_14610 [Iodidimonas nitroreducens]|uniref:HTH asnC-type domain-containing protein n=1 Tax=Iodidimonas nitroreducens TaxID=1236968 RepID=A0A5A7N9N7_9PROT|nr:Lrp/AsnC family transcriptional regulator [Iodidimonas nitroreducens]GER03779.1 hypothetical protein JCM17846_14610 [Iodidimonas nitroreducens]
MARVKLDAVDMKILTSLQDEGRMTNVDLAERVGITAPPCLRRVRALEESGFIRGYHADLDQEALGFGITVFALVSLRSQADADLQAFERKVADWPLVRECFMLNGEIDFILKIVARDLAEFQRFLTSELTSSTNVESVKTSLTIRSSKRVRGAFAAPEKISIAHGDEQRAWLQAFGRQPARALLGGCAGFSATLALDRGRSANPAQSLGCTPQSFMGGGKAAFDPFAIPIFWGFVGAFQCAF